VRDLWEALKAEDALHVMLKKSGKVVGAIYKDSDVEVVSASLKMRDVKDVARASHT